jgi:hypothetical protein
MGLNDQQTEWKQVMKFNFTQQQPQYAARAETATAPAAAPAPAMPTAASASNAAPGRSPNYFVGDVIDRLPKEARNILLNLRERANELHSPTRDLRESIDFERTEAQKLRLQLEQIELNTLESERARLDENPNVIGLRASLVKRQENVARLQARHDACTAGWQPVRALVQACEKYLDEAPGKLVLHTGADPVLRKNETAASAVERCRRRARELTADIAKIKAAPWPSELRKAAARQQLADLAERGRVAALGSIDHGEELKFPSVQADVWQNKPEANYVAVSSFDALGLIAKLFPAQLIALAESEIDKCADDDAALSPAARSQALATALADKLATEREEAYFANAAGLAPRPEIDARAMLNIDGPPPR